MEETITLRQLLPICLSNNGDIIIIRIETETHPTRLTLRKSDIEHLLSETVLNARIECIKATTDGNIMLIVNLNEK